MPGAAVEHPGELPQVMLDSVYGAAIEEPQGAGGAAVGLLTRLAQDLREPVLKLRRPQIGAATLAPWIAGPRKHQLIQRRFPVEGHQPQTADLEQCPPDRTQRHEREIGAHLRDRSAGHTRRQRERARAHEPVAQPLRPAVDPVQVGHGGYSNQWWWSRTDGSLPTSSAEMPSTTSSVLTVARDAIGIV